MTDKDLGAAAGDIFAKAFTLGYETGRNYFPPGEVRLTAEQVELLSRVLGAIREFEGPASDLTAALALFPATEPAEERLARNPETLARIKSALASTDGDTEIPEPAEAAKFELPEGHVWDKDAAAEPFSERLKQYGWDELRRRGHKVAEPAKECTTWGDCGAAEHLDFCHNAPPPAPAEPAEDVVTVTDGDVAAAWEDGFTAGCGHASADCQPRSTTFAAEEETKAEESAGTVCDETQKTYDEAVSLSYWLAKQLGEHVDDSYDRGETLTDTVQRLVASSLGSPTEGERKSPELWYIEAQDRPNSGNSSAYVDTEARANYYAKLFQDTGYLNVAIYPPVVPASTETGPWETWQEVPEGVKSVRDRTGQCWRYYPFIGWSCDFLGHRATPMNEFAPFVAAREGRA